MACMHRCFIPVTSARYHCLARHHGYNDLKSTRIFAIAGIVILVAVLAWWHYQETHARRMGFSSGHGNPVELSR